MAGAKGRQLGAAFKVIETQRELHLDVVRALCLPNSDPVAIAHVARNAVSIETTRRFANNFWRTLESNGSSRNDDGGVSVLQIGATQFRHSSRDYLDQCSSLRSVVDSLFEGISTDDKSRILGTRWLEPALRPLDYRIEPAQFEGRYVAECTARAWRNQGAFLLEPHEDAAQLSPARQDDFEIGSTTSLVAWVCCIDVEEGGDLILWDIAPDEEMRTQYNLVGTGYPYPNAVVEPFPKLEMAFHPGDVLLFRADFLHAISPVVGSRISVGRFLGALNSRLMYWT